MKALVQKDLYVLKTQMKLFVVMALVFAVMPNDSMNAFAAVYASMLPYTALAYDERSKWDQLASMMPYSSRQLVLSKYILGYICIFGITVISLAVRLVLAVFTHRTVGLSLLLTMACTGMVILALSLPLLMRFGVERGRMVFTFGIIAVAIGAASAMSILAESAPPALLLNVCFPLVVVALNIGSIALSIKLYPKRSL